MHANQKVIETLNIAQREKAIFKEDKSDMPHPWEKVTSGAYKLNMDDDDVYDDDDDVNDDNDYDICDDDDFYDDVD